MSPLCAWGCDSAPAASGSVSDATQCFGLSQAGCNPLQHRCPASQRRNWRWCGAAAPSASQFGPLGDNCKASDKPRWVKPKLQSPGRQGGFISLFPLPSPLLKVEHRAEAKAVRRASNTICGAGCPARRGVVCAKPKYSFHKGSQIAAVIWKRFAEG